MNSLSVCCDIDHVVILTHKGSISYVINIVLLYVTEVLHIPFA